MTTPPADDMERITGLVAQVGRTHFIMGNHTHAMDDEYKAYSDSCEIAVKNLLDAIGEVVRERDELREKLAGVIEAARAVIPLAEFGAAEQSPPECDRPLIDRLQAAIGEAGK